MTDNITNASRTIGTTAVVISPNIEGGELIDFVVINTSTGGQVISLSIGQQAVASSGITLYAGGSWVQSIGPNYDISTEAIWAVSSAASGTISIHKRVKRHL